MPSQVVGDTLASNTLDALSIGWTSLLNTKGIGGKPLADQVSVAVDAKFAAPALMLVMNRAKWDAMPADLQAIVAKHSPALSDGGAAARETADLAAKNKVLADRRITAISFSDAQVAELNRVVTPAIDDWKVDMAKRGLDGEKLYKGARIDRAISGRRQITDITTGHRFATAGRPPLRDPASRTSDQSQHRPDGSRHGPQQAGPFSRREPSWSIRGPAAIR